MLGDSAIYSYSYDTMFQRRNLEEKLYFDTKQEHFVL